MQSGEVVEELPGFLIVEDEPVVARALERAVEPFGRARWVTTCAAARGLLREESWLGLLADFALPDGDGLELAAWARGEQLARESIVLSGTVDSNRLQRAYEAGIPFLLKPASPQSIRLFARRALSPSAGLDQDRVRGLVAIWRARYSMTEAESEILNLAIAGTPREEIHVVRGVSLETVKKQAHRILQATGDRTLESAVSRFLRELLGDPVRAPARDRSRPRAPS